MKIKSSKSKGIIIGAVAGVIIAASAVAIASSSKQNKTAAKTPQSATAPAAKANPVDMNKVSYLLGYGAGKMLKQQKITLSMPEFSKGLESAHAGQPIDKSDTNKSYEIGYSIAEHFKQGKVDVVDTNFENGLNQGYQGVKPEYTQAQAKQIMTAFIKRKMQQYKAMATTNAAASAKFMASVAKQPNIHKIANGLYYRVIKKGNGPMPTAKDTVTVNYEGKLVNNNVFDSSYKRGQPAHFAVDKVIPGWTQALEHMPQGSTWELYIAPQLAYGEMAPPSIGPEQALIFKVNLMSIQKATT
jgi:FKBP-type peptidyl-prolyl cis-trans isomerase FklB